MFFPWCVFAATSIPANTASFSPLSASAQRVPTAAADPEQWIAVANYNLYSWMALIPYNTVCLSIFWTNFAMLSQAVKFIGVHLPTYTFN